MNLRNWVYNSIVEMLSIKVLETLYIDARRQKVRCDGLIDTAKKSKRQETSLFHLYQK